MNDRFELTLILVSYHSEEPLRRFFASCSAHPIAASHEIIVVDNSPGDGTAEWLEAEQSAVRVLPMTGNVGYARAVNAGIEASRGEHVLVINPDVELASGAVDRSLEYLAAHPQVGLVGAQLLDPDGTIQRNARRFYSLTTILLRRTPLGRFWPDHPELRRHLMLDDDLERPGPVDWMTGAYMLVRREALESVGPMDGRFFLYFEDVDWCYRMWEGGWEVHLLPDVRLVHEFQRTSNRIGKTLLHHVRSFVSFYDKWGALVYVAKRLRRGSRTGAAVFSDLLALNLAFLAAFYARRALDPLFPQPLFDLVHYWPLILSVNVVSLVVLPLVGRYRDEEEVASTMQRSFRELRATFFVTLVVMAGVYLSYTRTFSRAVILFFVPAYLASLALTRAWRERVLGGLRREDRDAHRALLIGPASAIDAWAEQLQSDAARDRLVGGLATDGAVVTRLRDLGPVERLEETVDRYRISEVLVAGCTPLEPDLRATVGGLGCEGLELLVDQPWASEFGPDIHRVHRWGRDWWSARRFASTSDAAGSKWLIDRIAGSVLALVALPGYLLCSTLGRAFGVRSRRLLRLGQKRHPVSWSELVDREGRALPGIVQAPLFGAVTTGRLSLVGPYPLPLGVEEELGPVELLRFAVKPGLTGPWQGSRGSGRVEDLTRDDLRYLQQWSLAHDTDLFVRALPRLLLDDDRWHRVVSTL